MENPKWRLIIYRRKQYKKINDKLRDSEELRLKFHNKLRVGVQWDTETKRKNTTSDEESHRVCQVYSSAVPIAYDRIAAPDNDWSILCPLVLNATYEATFAVGVIKVLATNSKAKVVLCIMYNNTNYIN